MQEIKTVIRSPYEPNDVHALWIDTSNIDSPIVKVHENGKWQGIGGDGGGSSSEETEIPADGFAPNTFYNLGTITEDTIFLMAEGEEGKANHYFWVFETGAEAPEITWPEDIRMWEDNKAPVIAANHHYEISVYDGVGLYEVIGIEAPNPMIYQPLTFDVEYEGSDEIRFFYKAYIFADSQENYDEIIENRLQSIEASTDGGNTWFEVEPVTYPFDDTTKSVLLNDGDTIMFRGDHPMQVFFPDLGESNSVLYHFYFSSGNSPKLYVYGNPMSLLDSNNFSEMDEVPDYGLVALLGDYTEGVPDIDGAQPKEGYDLVLPASKLGDYCYYSMFNSCESWSRLVCLATDLGEIGEYGRTSCESWLYGAFESGTLICAKGMKNEWLRSGFIPEGWTVVEEGGGGEDTSDVVRVTPQTLSSEQQMQARGNLGLYGSYDFASYGEASLVDVNSSMTAALFGVARKNTDGTYTELEDYDDIISALPTYEEINSDGGIYVGDEFVDSYEKKSELTTCLSSSEWDIYITLGSDLVPSGYSSGDFVFNAPGIYVIQGDETTPNQNVAWSKDVKVPSKYVPDVDLTNKKIPGVIYLDVAHARSTMSGPTELNTTPDRVAELFNITRDEVQELFLTSGIYLHHTTFLAIKDNNDNGTDIWYYDKYQMLVDRMFTPNDPSPIISNEGDGRKLFLQQPDTPGYVQLEIKLLDRTSLLSGFNVSITSPD